MVLCNTGGVTIKATPGDADVDWAAATRDAMVALIGEKETTRVLDRVLPVIPAGYDELNWPTTTQATTIAAFTPFENEAP